MKEILKSKMMILFAIFVIGICYISGCRDAELDKKDLHDNQTNASQVNK